MNRREFLKKAYQIGGLAALYSLGAGAIEEAKAWGILPALVSGKGNRVWADWDEASEDTLSVDQDEDGAEDTNICFGENTVAGGDETSRGVETGADLVFSQNGNVAGATGSPPSRYCDGTDDRFEFTDNLYDALLAGQDKWTVIVKVNLATGANYLLDIFNANARINFNADAIEHRFIFNDSDNAQENLATTNAWPTGSVIWVAAWTDESYTRAGVATFKPTKWSDFGANYRVEATNVFDNLAASPLSTTASLVGINGGNHNECYLYYVLMSKTCLIDNSAWE